MNWDVYSTDRDGRVYWYMTFARLDDALADCARDAEAQDRLGLVTFAVQSDGRAYA